MHGVVAHSPGWLACKSSHWVMASLRSASHGFGVHANAIWSPFAHVQRTVVLDGSQGGRLVVVVVEVVLVVVVVGQGPQSTVPPQPSETIPQSCMPQALGVQQVPKSGFAFPGGGAGFMQLRLQQLMFV